MGVMMDRFSNIMMFHRGDSNKLKKMRKKQLQTVEIKVKMDCEGCERKVRKSVEFMKGVTQINIEQKKHKLTVSGYIDPHKVLHRVRHYTGKKAEFWPPLPQVPHDIVDRPYGSGDGYNNKPPPPGYVLNVHADNPHHYGAPLADNPHHSIEVKYYSAFSDENANACSIM